MKTTLMKKVPTYGDGNDTRAWDLTLWGYEILMALEENYLAPYFCNRDYTADNINELGETVNVRVGSKVSARRRNIDNPIKKQKLKGTVVPVKLDQLWHFSFPVGDWGKSRQFGDIINRYLRPAAQALAQGMNQSVLAQGVRQYANGNVRAYGKLDGLSPTNAVSNLAGFNGVMNVDQDWGGAPLFIDGETRTTLLQVEQFTKTNEHGNDLVLRKAYLGEKFDMQLYKSSDVAGSRHRVPTNMTTTTAAALKGATVIAVASATGIVAGRVISVDGKPYKVASVATLNVTLSSGLLESVASGASVKAYGQTTVDGAVDKDHAEEIVFDDTVYSGDVLSIGDHTYTVIQINDDGVLLDRPLEADVADGAVANIWPGGAYNFAFAPNNIVLAARALDIVPPGLGAECIVTSYNGLPIRITRGYDMDYQQIVVTVDILGGLAPVIESDGGVLLT